MFFSDVRVYSDGEYTFAILDGKCGFAKIAKNDVFDLAKGIRISLLRLFTSPEREPFMPYSNFVVSEKLQYLFSIHGEISDVAIRSVLYDSGYSQSAKNMLQYLKSLYPIICKYILEGIEVSPVSEVYETYADCVSDFEIIIG